MAPKKGGKAAKEEAAEAPAQSAWEVRIQRGCCSMLQHAARHGAHVPCNAL